MVNFDKTLQKMKKKSFKFQYAESWTSRLINDAKNTNMLADPET